MIINVFDDKKSIMHFFLGISSAYFKFIFVIFLFYEVIEKMYYNDAFFGDFMEFCLGVAFITLLRQTF